MEDSLENLALNIGRIGIFVGILFAVVLSPMRAYAKRDYLVFVSSFLGMYVIFLLAFKLGPSYPEIAGLLAILMPVFIILLAVFGIRLLIAWGHHKEWPGILGNGNKRSSNGSKSGDAGKTDNG